MILEIHAAPPMMTNGFVLGCEETREGVIIDPGDCADALIETAQGLELSIKAILLTHAHFDHITGVGRAKAAFPAPIYLHRDELFLYDGIVELGRLFGLRLERQPPVDAFYEFGDGVAPYRFGRYEVRVHHTPGHSPGGVCLEVSRAADAGAAGTGAAAGGTAGSGAPDARTAEADTAETAASARTLIVGDTLFAGSIGRTDLPGGDMDTLLDGIRRALFAFPDETPVYPGHGEPTTIGRERRTNPFLRAYS